MNDDETYRDIVVEFCELLETSPLRLMHPAVNESALELADMIEEIGHPAAAERLRTGWEVLKEQFKKSLGNIRAGSKDDALEPKKQPLMVAPACIRCNKGVTDYGEVKDYGRMFCVECRSLPDGPELAPIFQRQVARIETALARLSTELFYVKDRLVKCRG
jgi:hypothetical protein